jgi:hypothetical protein
MSLVTSALRMDLDGGRYLEGVLTPMLRRTAKTEELLPDRWKAAHPEAVREYREQELRDKADTAVLQAARRRRVRAELRKGKWYVRMAMIAEQYPWVSWALRTEPRSWATCVCGVSLATTMRAP